MLSVPTFVLSLDRNFKHSVKKNKKQKYSKNINLGTRNLNHYF